MISKPNEVSPDQCSANGPSPNELSPNESSPDQPSQDEPSSDEPSPDQPSPDEPSAAVLSGSTLALPAEATQAADIAILLPDEAATVALGQRLARTLPPRAVVHLHGDLGAGKTTLARALLRALGVAGAIKSPTYTLVERYPLEGGEVAHLDLYRIADPEELEFLGLDELSDSARLWLVEWPQQGAGVLPAPDLRIALVVEGEGRGVELKAQSPVGRDWIQQFNKSP